MDMRFNDPHDSPNTEPTGRLNRIALVATISGALATIALLGFRILEALT